MNLVSQYSDGYEIAEKIQPDYPRLITEDEKKYGGWFELIGRYGICPYLRETYVE
jgi:hypothetical protein